MRVQQTVFVMVVSVYSVAFAPSKAWPQSADPFGGVVIEDPFGLPSKVAKSTNSRQADSKQKHAKQVPSNDTVHVVTVGEREMDQRIHMTLQDETSHTFVETPLEEAVQQISQTHNIPMLVDARALEEIGLTPDTPVNLALKHVSLRSFLRLMLRNLELTYMVKDEVLQITTLESAEQNLETRMYHLPELLSSKTDKVIESLQSAVEPDTWEALGGPSTTSSINNVLIVSTTSDVHQQVYDFLDTLIHMHEIK